MVWISFSKRNPMQINCWNSFKYGIFCDKIQYKTNEIKSVILTQVKLSKQLISQDESSNEYNYKYNFSVELPRICKDDLVIIPRKMKSLYGGCNELLLCQKVNFYIFLN